MKKTFLKILPLAVAVLLATSCSKDNDSNVAPAPVETQNIASPSESSPTESKSVPFSIKVVGGGSLSKIAYADDGSTVTTKFEESDRGNVALYVTDTYVTICLTLAEVDEQGVATFEGDWGETSEPAEGTEMYAYCHYNGESTVTTSTTSLTDLMKNCAHTYTGTFEYKTDDKVMLTDNNAYIEIIMSPLQKDIDLTIGGTPQNFDMKDGKVWIAVAGGTTFTTNFTGEKTYTCTAGRITTINRAGFVDLGIPGILWADRNLGATNVYDYGNYYAWGEVEPKFDYSWGSYSYGRDKKEGETHEMVNKYCPTDKSDWYEGKTPDDITTLEPADDAATVTNPKWKMPTQSDFAALTSNCHWEWVDNYNGSSVKGYVVYKKKSGDSPSYSVADDTHIFLPAAGHCIDDTPPSFKGSDGKYWSSSLSDYPDRGCGLDFHSGSADPDCVSSRPYGRSVRAVRCK